MSRIFDALQRTTAEEATPTQVAALESAIARRVSSVDDIDAEQLLFSASLGIDTSSIQVRRYVPVEVYCVREDFGEAADLQTCLDRWLATVGLSSVRQTPWEYGSLRLRSVHRTKGRLTSEDLMLVQTLLKVTMEDALASMNVSVRRGEHPKKDELEEAKVRSEIAKNRAAAFKAVGDGAISLAKAILTASVGVSILVGTFRISKIEVPALSVPKIVIESISPKQAVGEWSASRSAAAPRVSQQR